MRYGESRIDSDLVSTKRYGTSITYGMEEPRFIYPGSGEISSEILTYIAGTAVPSLTRSRTLIQLYLSDDINEQPLNLAPIYAFGYDEPYDESYDRRFFDKGFWSHDLDIANGQQTIYARAQNEADSVISDAVPLTFIRDDISPTVILITNCTNNKRIEGTAFDISDTITSVFVTLIGDTPYQESYSDFAGTIFFANLTLQSDGTYIWDVVVDSFILGTLNTIQITAMDAGGLTTTIEEQVLYETVAPTIAFSNEYFNSVFVRGTYLNITTSAQPIAGDIDYITVNKVRATFKDGVWVCDLTYLGDGRHTVIAEIFDDCGNVSSTEASIFIGSAIPTGTIDTSSMNSANDKFYTNVNIILGTYVANGSIPLASVILTNVTAIDGQSLLTDDGYEDNLFNGIYNISDLLVPGDNVLELEIINKAGSKAIVTKTICYDITAPTLLSVHPEGLNTLILVFSEELNIETANIQEAYAINPTVPLDARAEKLIVTEIITPWNNNSNTVLLRVTPPQLAQQNYQIVARGLEDLAGNALG